MTDSYISTDVEDRYEIIGTLVDRFIDSLTLDDALEYIINDMIDRYNSMTNDELIRELED